jgi:hypothetical protein
MPNNYPTADEQADRLLPYRWQVQTMEDARKLVRIYLGSEDEAVVLAFYKRCACNYKKEIE